MSIASFFQDNDKDDRFTHANSNTIGLFRLSNLLTAIIMYSRIQRKSGCKSELQKLSQINACLHMALDNNVGSEKKNILAQKSTDNE